MDDEATLREAVAIFPLEELYRLADAAPKLELSGKLWLDLILRALDATELDSHSRGSFIIALGYEVEAANSDNPEEYSEETP